MDNSRVLEQLAELTRREALSRGLAVAGWGAFAAVLGTGTVETVNFFFPRVRFQPPSTFRIGTVDGFLGSGERPDTYGVVLVDERWKPAQRFFVVRERDHIYAVSARCAHLGCTVNWFGDQRIFKCPCHGSEYAISGKVVHGPATKNLYQHKVVVRAGQVWVYSTRLTS